MIRAALALVAALALAGCETTEQESAAIAKRLGDRTAAPQQTTITSANHAIEVLRAAIVHTRSGTAAAIELRNTTASAQVDVPIVITAYDAAGKAVYSNDTIGTASPSGELSLLGAHATAWWVDANVFASGGVPVRVTARLGASSGAAAAAGTIGAGELAGGSNFAGPFIAGTAIDSGSAEADATVYVVALRDGRVVAAGQGLIPSLAAHGSTAFQATVVGSASRARLEATIVPAHLS